MKAGSNSPWAWALRAVAAVLLVAVGLLAAGVWQPFDSEVKPELTGIAQEMRKAPEDWSKLEKDGSSLVADLHANSIEALGIAGSSVLVSNKAGEKYFVVDGRGAFASLVMSSVKDTEEGKPAYQLVVLPDVKLGASTAGSSVLSGTRDVIGLMFPLLLIGFLVYMVKGEVVGGAKVLQKPDNLRFSDVIGAGEAKGALNDVVSYLKDPKKYAALGARPPCGVLMLGGPGVGKTLLAKALAGECGANFIATNGSEFTSKFYGVGVQKVKKLFALARKNAPCVLFIDEIDGIAKRTSGGHGPGESESNRIINQVLVEMDGFESNEGIIVVGATNLADNLDEALLREGRFDRRVNVKLPDVRDRADILKLYANKVKVSGEVDYVQLARLTTGLSPAALAYIVNHAALVAARKSEPAVAMADFLEAIETARIGELNGAERALNEEERRRIAVHEAGHAIVAAALGFGVVEKVTILPRGGALGVTLVTQNEDKTLHLQSDLQKRIQMLLGGRNAELEVYQEASTGAGQDLQEASKLALEMVGRHGFGLDGALFSLGALPAEYAAQQISVCVKQANQVLAGLNTECQTLLREKRAVLDSLTDELLRDETVPGERVLELLALPQNTARAAVSLA